MQILLFIIVLFCSFLVGAFGFSQIVGSIKYFRTFNPASALITILLWLAILGFGAFAVINWLNNCWIALVIGYVASFIMSLSTKADKEIENTTPKKRKLNLSFMEDEDRIMYEQFEMSIQKLTETVENAKRDLNGMTVEELDSMYNRKLVSKEQYGQISNAIQSLNMIIELTPANIDALKKEQEKILLKYSIER